MGNLYFFTEVLLETMEETDHIRNRMNRWQNNIKTDMRQIVCEGVD